MLIRVQSVVSMLVLVGGLLLPGTASAVNIDWVTVGAPGNLFDFPTFRGAVASTYRISKYEVTNAQYAEFLNAVAATDSLALYNTNMGSVAVLGGITRSGTSGSFTYSTIAGRDRMAVNYVSFYDTLRFANWLHNGQGAGSTETGAYTITPAGIAANSITRNAGATIFLTSEDEWYKAAYFDGTSYFDYSAGMDTRIVCAEPGATPNTANCGFLMTQNLTHVASYTGSGSPYGTFDQGGNVWEWNETIISGSNRGLRGGSFYNPPINLAALYRPDKDPTGEDLGLGFRVASLVPEPGTALLLAASMLGLTSWRRGQRH